MPVGTGNENPLVGRSPPGVPGQPAPSGWMVGAAPSESSRRGSRLREGAPHFSLQFSHSTYTPYALLIYHVYCLFSSLSLPRM